MLLGKSSQSLVSEQSHNPKHPKNAFESNQFPALRNEDRSLEDYIKRYLKRKISQAYEKVVYWKRNIFVLPKGKQRKVFIQEMTNWVNKWCNKMQYGDIAFNAMFIMSSLLLQRTTIKSIDKENKETLERRLMLWNDGNILELLKEGQVLHNRLENHMKDKRNYDDLTKRFNSLMINGNVKGAIRLVESDAAI